MEKIQKNGLNGDLISERQAMKHAIRSIVALQACAGFSAMFGCAEQSHHIDPNEGYQVVSFEYDGADCIAGDVCVNAFNEERDIYKTPFEGNRSGDERYRSGYFGYIDDGCHSIRSNASRADIDVIGVDVMPGAALRVAVSSASMQSTLNPVAYLLDSAGKDLLFSMNAGNAIDAKLSFLAPTERFYITVESGANEASGSAQACVDGQTHRGGERYGYAVVIEPISDTELIKSFGEISNAKEYRTKFGGSAGTALYYKAKVPDGMDLRVDLQTSSINAYPTISPINRKDWYRWVYAGDVLKSTFDPSALTATATVSSDYADDEGYLWFAISDFNAGKGYNFKLTVTPQ